MPSPDHFADRLSQAVSRCKNPICVGLDPRAELLPPSILPNASTASVAQKAKAYQAFSQQVIDVVKEIAPIVKPQAAFFEQLGPAGMHALGEVVTYAGNAGLMVILDGKRNDIGSTATAYADAYLGPGDQSVWGADALTVSPYLGNDSISPFVDVAAQRGAGIFVLVKTSNPGGSQFQDLQCDTKNLYEHVADYVEELATQTVGSCGYGSVGGVVGATYPEQLQSLRAPMPHTWFLVPGFGSQGGTAADVASAFDAKGHGAIINNSRGLLFAYTKDPYREKFGAARWQDALEAATRDMIAQLRSETPVGKLQ